MVSENNTFKINTLIKTTKNRWFCRGCLAFGIIYFFGGEGFFIDGLRRARGIFRSDCWFRAVITRSKLSS